MRRYLLLTLLSLIISANGLQAQYVPIHVSYNNIYDFVDELGNDKIIDLSSVVKPYSKADVLNYLKIAKSKENQLTVRQRKEVDFYLNKYALEDNRRSKKLVNLYENNSTQISLIDPSVTYSDSLLAIRFSPILGMKIYDNQKDRITHRWFGAEFDCYLGKHLSIYASLRDNSITGGLLSDGSKNVKIKSPFTKKDTTIITSGYLTQLPGGAYKRFANSNDYSEMRGGIYYTWKWGHIGIAKDHITYGDNYNGSNILSGRTPSFPFIKLNLKPSKVIEFNWFHGWLTSKVIDSTDFYVENTGKKDYRYRDKYIASNMITITPFRNFNFSFGNSIVYAEKNINIGYCIPFLFYKSADHSLTMGTENQNSQLFLNISSRNIKHVHLFGSFFFDEIKWGRFSSSSEEKNPLSYKLGMRLSNWPIRNISSTIEYTKNTITAYNHFIPALTYSSNNYNLGHYLGDNATEIYADLSYSFLKSTQLKFSYTNAKHGNQYSYINKDVLEIISEPFMKDVVWESSVFSIKLQSEIVSNIFIEAQLDISNVKGHDISGKLTSNEFYSKGEDYLNMYSSSFLQGNKNIFSVSMYFGL